MSKRAGLIGKPWRTPFDGEVEPLSCLHLEVSERVVHQFQKLSFLRIQNIFRDQCPVEHIPEHRVTFTLLLLIIRSAGAILHPCCLEVVREAIEG